MSAKLLIKVNQMAYQELLLLKGAYGQIKTSYLAKSLTTCVYMDYVDDEFKFSSVYDFVLYLLKSKR